MPFIVNRQGKRVSPRTFSITIVLKLHDMNGRSSILETIHTTTTLRQASSNKSN